MVNIHSILKRYWGYDTFRSLQEDVIQSVLAKNDTLALMPTGGGKSLCYQVPAMVMEGLCLVVSPLIALMKDQVENLRRKGITAYSIYSGMSRNEVINTLQIASDSNCKFLYVSPERLETSLFHEYITGLGVCLIAVDEAHCISQWGYDFRPSYLKIAVLREDLPHVPVIALTASATVDVQSDICDKLLFKKHTIFRQSFERSNLSYSVFKVESRITKLLEILKNVQGCAIVYCKSRKRTREVSDLLQLQNIPSDFYHAGLTSQERSLKQEEWISNKTRVIVSTSAFGMGIDKPDVRLVIHIDAPDCLENYYQEAGRAGRDGNKAYSVLLYDEKDINEIGNSSIIRYPSLETIRNIYQAVSNYLQVPSDSAEGIYFDFDLNDFLKKFKLNNQEVIYSLKALEQEGWLSFNESAFLPSRLQFCANKDVIFEFEKNNPTSEPLIKALLRAYEGIVDFPAVISELFLAGLLKKNITDLKNELVVLHRAGIVQYYPQKDKPQILFLSNRIKSEDLSIDMVGYNQRKNKSILRSGVMVSYIKEKVVCRSKIIGTYFGDTKIINCGICDNCLSQKKVDISKDEFDKINDRIISAVQQPILAKDLLQKLNGIKKEKAWKVLNHLQAENKIKLDDAGFIKLSFSKGPAGR